MNLLHLASLIGLVWNVNSIPIDTQSGPGLASVGGDSYQKILTPSDEVDVSAVPVGQIITQCTVAGTFALTFDDGPYIYTDKILDILKANGAKATFFVNGLNWASINDDASKARIRRMIAEGHQIGSHTYLTLLFPSFPPSLSFRSASSPDSPASPASLTTPIQLVSSRPHHARPGRHRLAV